MTTGQTLSEEVLLSMTFLRINPANVGFWLCLVEVHVLRPFDRCLKSAAVLVLLLSHVLLSSGRVQAGQEPDLERDIRPLFQQKCGACHGAGERKGGLRLDARSTFFKGGDGGPVVVIGDSGQSELVRRVESEDPDLRMPPDGPELTADEISTLRQWIDLGASWPEADYDRDAAKDPRLQHWAFQAPAAASVPELPANVTSTGTGEVTAIDRFLLHRLADAGLSMNPPAERRELIRRAALILTGLLPTPEQTAVFVEDTRPDAWEHVIEQLLASRHYGERWAQHWLDVVRYADTHGFEVNTPREHAWPYRDYVIRSFNEDRPYDRFVREQIAGDVLGEDAATGFLVASAVLLPGQIGADDASKRLARQDALDEIIAGTSNAILGLTIGCARCHDHKFDPITQLDYYNMQAFFAGVEYGDRPLRDHSARQRLAEAEQLGPRIAELQEQLQTLESPAWLGRTLMIDETDSRRVRFLKAENGPGANPAGTQRGYRDDAGSAEQPGNLSGGRYTWWNNTPGEDVLAYRPGVSGTWKLWLSWGVHGSGVHTRDARYVLDQDGDPATRQDQRELARVDQYYPAGVSTGTTDQAPQWSGLQFAGVVELTDASALLVRGGETGTGITADVIVLQEVLPESAGSALTTVTNVTTVTTVTGPRLRAPVNALLTTERFAPVQAKFLRFTTFATMNNNQHQTCLDELEVFGPMDGRVNLAAASRGVQPTSSGNVSETGIHQLKHVNDGRYGNDYSWIPDRTEGSWVQLQWPEIVELDRVEWSRDRLGKFADRLPIDYEIAVSVDGVTWTVVAQSDDRAPLGTPWDPVHALVRDSRGLDVTDVTPLVRELQELREKKTQLETQQLVFAGVFQEPHPTWMLRRGDPEQRVEETGIAVPAVFQGSHSLQDVSGGLSTEMGTMTEDQRRRLMLANWLGSEGNPLTARVLVNRVWQHHFGRGLVDTPNDFGLNGSAPVHPELLDWLTAEFVRGGWSLKHLHRLILRTAAWQQSSRLTEDGLRVDRDNRLVWHFESRRVESEVIRDCMLQLSGELNLKAGGPGFNFFRSKGGLDGFPPVEQFTAEEMRRMVYAHRVRMETVPVFGAFDCPDAGQSMPRRSRSTTAIQALNLFNSPFVVERSRQFAARVAAERPGTISGQIERIFQLAVGHGPTAAQRDAAVRVAEEHGVETVCRVVLNSSEFLMVP